MTDTGKGGRPLTPLARTSSYAISLAAYVSSRKLSVLFQFSSSSLSMPSNNRAARRRRQRAAKSSARARASRIWGRINNQREGEGEPDHPEPAAVIPEPGAINPVDDDAKEDNDGMPGTSLPILDPEEGVGVYTLQRDTTPQEQCKLMLHIINNEKFRSLDTLIQIRVDGPLLAYMDGDIGMVTVRDALTVFLSSVVDAF